MEGALIHYLITGPLAWLGLLDLGPDSMHEPITDKGCSCRGQAEGGKGQVVMWGCGVLVCPQISQA